MMLAAVVGKSVFAYHLRIRRTESLLDLGVPVDCEIWSFEIAKSTYIIVLCSGL